MIAGEAVLYGPHNDNPKFDGPVLIELTDWGNDPFVEIATDVGKKRVYLRFRVADLLREIKEANTK